MFDKAALRIGKLNHRIAFDVDEALIPYHDAFPVERSLPSPPLRIWFKEQLRQGTIAWFKELRWQGHDLWIYTTSGRTDTYFRNPCVKSRRSGVSLAV